MSLKNAAFRAGRPSEAKKAATLASLADKAPTVRINFDLDREQHTRLKIMAAQQQTTIADLLRVAIDDVLSKRGTE